MDETALWENGRMIHCATGTAIDETRHMQRTTIAGDYALGRIFDAPERYLASQA